ncbi:MAG: tetratricopeptide repeat protein [Potamolinea sp.]
MKSVSLSLPKFNLSLLLALPIVGILLIAAISLKLWNENTGIDSAYRYRFGKSSTGNVTSTLSKEISFYQERISRNPQAGLDNTALAQVYLKMARATGDANWYLLAEQTAKRSLSNLPFNNSGAILALAKIAEARHDFKQTIELSQKVLQEKPGHEDALSLLVTSYLAIGKVDEATRVANQLVEQIPSLGTLTLRALVNQAQGKDEAAIKDFKLALAAEEPGEAGSSAWVRTLLGRFYYKRGNHQLAGQLYRESLRILPRYPLALISLAELETRRKNYNTAIEYYSQVFISPAYQNVFDHVALHGIAVVKKLQSDEVDAKKQWEQAKHLLREHLDISSFGHRRELARLLLESEQSKDTSEALSLMQAEVKVRRDPETLDTLAWALTNSGLLNEARQVMKEALSGGIREAGMFYRAGIIEQKLGNSAEAAVYFQLAQKTDPTFDEQARLLLGIGRVF